MWSCRVVQASDAVFVVANDDMHMICTKMLHLKSVSFQDMNGVCVSLCVLVLVL